jgi:ATP-binding cassette subfamily B protein
LNGKPVRVLASSLGRALQLVWRSAPRLAVEQGLLAVAQALLPLVTLYALKRAVDAASGVVHAMTAVGGTGAGSWRLLLQSPAGQGVALWFVVGATAMGANACLRALASWISEQHAMAVSDRVHAQLHAKLMTVDLAFFEDLGEQNRLHLAQAQAMAQPIGVLNSLFQILRGLVGMTGVLLLLGAVHPFAALALALAGVPALILRLRRGRRLYAWRRDLAPLEREAGYFHRVLTGADFAKELRMHGHGAFCRARFEDVRRRLRNERLVWRRYVLSSELAMQIFMLAILAALLLWMTGRLVGGALTLGTLVMVVQALQRGQSQMGLLVGAVAELHQSALFLQAFDELMKRPAHVAAPAVPREVAVPMRQGIVFEHVTFTYPGTSRQVLRDLSLAIRPGERLAIVGANAAGKSTVVKLLCRLYDPTEGCIRVDGVDLRELDPEAWRRRIGVLFQDYGRYPLTAGENIWIGDPCGTAADPRVVAAAQRAGLEEALTNWPQGLDTPLGRWLHEGVEPSMGQWQRIALARAFLRDADLLILDEPTSALDVRMQQEIIGMLKRAAASRAALVVSHRPEMLAWAQRVIVLRAGEVVEAGSVDALRQGHGEFARLFNLSEGGDAP